MKPLILLHGALGAEQDLIPLIEYLSNRTVITYEFKGHGKKAINVSSFTMEDLVQDFSNFLDDKQLDSVDIFGFSMGGYIALSLAQNDQRVDRIVTLGTKLAWSPEFAQGEQKKLVPDVIEAKVPKFARYMNALHGDQWKPLMSETASMMLGLGENPILNSESIPTIQNTVVVMRGGLDEMVTREESESVANMLPNGRYKELEGLIHPIARLDPELIANIICEALDAY